MKLEDGHHDEPIGQYDAKERDANRHRSLCRLPAPSARLTKYEVALLTPTNLTIRRCTILNPASLLPVSEDEEKGGGIVVLMTTDM